MLTVATWNIHAGIGRDRRHDLSRIWRVIDLLDADLIGLQEVVLTDLNDDPLLRWARAAGYAAHVAITRAGDAPGTHFGNILLSRLPLISQPTIDLSVPGRENRHLLCAEVRHGRHSLSVWVTHLGLKRSERRHQAALIHAHAQREDNVPANRILIGDFNEWWPGQNTLRRLRQSFRKLGTPASFPAHRPILTLDNIWVAGNIQLLNCDAIIHPLIRVASDHRPIRAQITLAVAGELG